MARAGHGTVREAVAVLEDAVGLEAAVAELRAAGFASDEISLLAAREAVERKLGHAYRRVEEIEDEAAVPRTAFVSRGEVEERGRRVEGALVVLPVVAVAGTVVASAGMVAAAVFGTALAGATLGSALAGLMEGHHAARLQEQLERGGLLLWVRTATPELERLAVGILTRHAAHDVHVHTIPAPEPAAPEPGYGPSARTMGGMLP